MSDDLCQPGDTTITSAEERFCVLQDGPSPRYQSQKPSCSLPTLPPFNPPPSTTKPPVATLETHVSTTTHPSGITTTEMTPGNDTITGGVTQLEGSIPPINGTATPVTQLEDTFAPINETSTQVYPLIPDSTFTPDNASSTQECCNAGLIVLVVCLIITSLVVIILVYWRYRKRTGVRDKFSPSKAEKANRTGQVAKDEVVPLQARPITEAD